MPTQVHRIIDVIHSGNSPRPSTRTSVPSTFRPTTSEGVPLELSNPKKAWAKKEAFEREVRKLGGMFQKVVALYEEVEEQVRLAGPQF